MAVRELYKKIDSIVFGMISPDLVRKISVAKIVTPELYDKEGYPVDGGLMDTRLGVIDPGLVCKIDGQKLKEGLGHFGYIELARPVLHVKFVPVILSFLRSTCRECGSILASDAKVAEHLESLRIVQSEEGTAAVRRYNTKFVNSLKNLKKCAHCGVAQKKIKIEKPTTFLEDEKRLSSIELRTRLERVSDRDVELLGLNPKLARPEWAILTVLPVPPVTIRPSITLETGERSEDDLTHKLGDIVRINQRLFENINAGAPEIIVEDLWDLLQYHITTYFDNSISMIPPARHRSGQALKTLAERIKSKQGRFRQNLAGKRVNFSARTVISPDSRIELNEIGVPKKIAMTLTVPERVTEWNMAYLRKFVEAGPKSYPGCNYVVRPDGRKKKITEETHEQLLEELQPGYVVERHLLDSDIVIFNRQPSLHRMSIMGHRVRVLPGKSFRLNPSVCHPYNADFDGDEMNLHVPQTEEARAEAEVLMEVQTQMISPKDGLNVVGCDADSITGNFILTKWVHMPREEAIQMLDSIGVWRPKRFAKFGATVSGKEIFSALLPDDFTFIGQTKSKEKFVVKDGHLVEGFVDKATIGQDKGDLIRALFAQYSSDVGIDLLGKIFRLGIASLAAYGFSTSVSDTDLPAEIATKCREVLYNAERRVAEYINRFESGDLEALPGMTHDETLELKIMEVLNKARNRVGEILAEVVDEHNPTITMAISGAKGNILNLAQMAACVGQQALRGKRIENGFALRTLPVFKKQELSPKSKGFVRNGYKSGLCPEEFYMHSMTGRDSLMDTALRTPKSGYLYRRLSSALQDLKIAYDATVRDASDNIIQFTYGDDGLDVSKTEGGRVNVDRIISEVLGK